MFLSPQNKVFGSISSQFGMGRMDGKKKEGKDILYKNFKKNGKITFPFSSISLALKQTRGVTRQIYILQ